MTVDLLVKKNFNHNFLRNPQSKFPLPLYTIQMESSRSSSNNDDDFF